MDDQRPAGKSGLIAVLALLVVPLIAYSFAYLHLSDHVRVMVGKKDNVLVEYRFFKYQWEATLFQPAAAIESFLSHRQIASVKYIGL